jgi:multidrug efflux pump subunit AcrA (membrane-fusion protein)
VAQRLVDPGTAIFPGSPLLVLESTANPQVVAEVPTTHLAHLRLGLEVSVFTGGTADALHGRIAEIVPQSDSSTHTVRFKVDIPAATAPSGAFARVQVPVGSRRALLVANRAFREAGQLTGLFVVDGSSKARFRLVKTIPFDVERREVLSGIEPGERIILGPPEDMVDGASVEVR